VDGASPTWTCGEAQEVPVEGPLDNGRMGQLGCRWYIAGRARKMAEKEEKEWVALVDTWNAEVDR
jgi:hypothetical protein